ncbi:MAG: virulence factor [Paracoccus sp. (in: a-proteobacteria)]
MSGLTLVYWRDIPAQVTMGKGRGATRVVLAERFEQAIDRAAMKAGLAGTDDYLSQWRRAPGDGEDPKALAARLEAEYDKDRLKALIANGGWNPDHTG